MKKIFSLFLIFIFIFSLSTNVFGFTIEYETPDGDAVRLNDFLDTKNHWAHDQILKWADYDIIVGNNGSFMPDNSIIRGDLSIILDRMLGLKNTTYNYFTDLNSNDYFRESILKCVAEGYINGIGNNKVNPRGNATREEVAVILCRVFNIDTSYTGSTGFKDDSSISSWARSSVYALSRLGYLNGTPDGKVNPKSNITRAEMITLLNNFADTYIPKRDVDSSGSTFVSNFPKNLVLGRNIELLNSTVGRDIYLTQNCSSLSLNNTKVMGRIVCFDRMSLDLSNSSVEQLYLCNGKSTVVGVTEDIREVYVCLYASESNLEGFPSTLVLEPGARVKIDGIMYENDTSRVKTYNSLTLKADISDEQGYVVGGPKISYSGYSLDYDNTLTFKNVKVTEGDNEIRELGVVWLESDEEEEPINPTYNKNDGKIRYRDGYYEPFDFEIEDVEDYCTYRLYVKDRDGLYAYSSPITLSAFDFSITMDISEEDYPKKLQVDVIFRGENVPSIRNLQVIYAEDDLYSEDKEMVSLRKYTEEYAENPTDDTKYLRYTGIINSPVERVDGEEVYTPPTAFGYIITFGDGSLINRFPILTGVIPDGIDPVNTLSIGDVLFNENKLIINGNKVITSLVPVEEVGIVYRESSSSSASNPSSNWNKIQGGRNIGIKETYTFNTTIPITNSTLNTFYALYVKTSNGYFYGDVYKVENNWLGDEGGPRITGTPIVEILGENSGIIKIPYQSSNDIDFNTNEWVVSVLKNGVLDRDFSNKVLNDMQCYIDSGYLIIYLDNIGSNINYNMNLRLKDVLGLYSNVVNVNFNTDDKIDVLLLDKEVVNNVIKYRLNFNTPSRCVINTSGHSVLNNVGGIVSGGSDLYGEYIYIEGNSNPENVEVLITFRYELTFKSYTFSRIVKLY